MKEKLTILPQISRFKRCSVEELSALNTLNLTPSVLMHYAVTAWQCQHLDRLDPECTMWDLLDGDVEEVYLENELLDINIASVVIGCAKDMFTELRPMLDTIYTKQTLAGWLDIHELTNNAVVIEEHE